MPLGNPGDEPPEEELCEHLHLTEAHNTIEGHHSCPDCGGDIPCEEVGPDLCGTEAAKADRADEIIQMLLGMPAGTNARAAACKIAERFGLEDLITHWDLINAQEETEEDDDA